MLNMSTTMLTSDRPAVEASWMMLERFVFRRDDDDGSFPDEAAAPMRAQSVTSLGDPFTVALLPTAPPAFSRLSGGPRPARLDPPRIWIWKTRLTPKNLLSRQIFTY